MMRSGLAAEQAVPLAMEMAEKQQEEAEEGAQSQATPDSEAARSSTGEGDDGLQSGASGGRSDDGFGLDAFDDVEDFEALLIEPIGRQIGSMSRASNFVRRLWDSTLTQGFKSRRRLWDSTLTRVSISGRGTQTMSGGSLSSTKSAQA